MIRLKRRKMYQDAVSIFSDKEAKLMWSKTPTQINITMKLYIIAHGTASNIQSYILEQKQGMSADNKSIKLHRTPSHVL